MKRILFLIIILFLFSGIALGYELGAGDGTGYPAAIDTDTSVEVDYPDPLATTARAAVPNDTNAAVIAIETELGINPSGTYDTLKARLDAGDGLYYLKTEIDTKFAELKFTDLSDTPVNYTGQAGKYTKVNAGETALEFGTPDAGGASTYLELTDTPADYTGNSLKFIRVNAGETALEFAAEADPNVDTDAEIKAILVDEVIKTGDFTVGRIAKINNATGIIEQGTNTDTEVADAVTKKHSQNADTDLDPTFEATFVKKTDSVNVLSDIDSTGAIIEDAVTRVHTQNTDTTLDMFNELGSDHSYSGLLDHQLVGESVVFGNLLYFDWNTKTWRRASAGFELTMPGLRIALETRSDGQGCKMLVMGYIRDDSWEFTAAMVYVDTNYGGVTSTAPSTAGQQLQRVGVAKSADILFFNPSIDVGEI